MSHRQSEPPSPVPVSGKDGHPSVTRYWPLPDTGRILPPDGGEGSFWEDRGDRRHAGVDLYARAGSRVVSIEEGTVISAGVFTSPDLVPYWNTTCQATIAHISGFFCRYAELGDLNVETGDPVSGGEVIGHVGEVLNLPLIGADAPPYIIELKERNRASMLHLELFSSAPRPSPEYRGGNWFSPERPPDLLDPAILLRGAV